MAISLKLTPGEGAYFRAGDLVMDTTTNEVMRILGVNTPPAKDYRLWDDWEWIEHSLEAHAAIRYFERPLPTIMTVQWNEDYRGS